MSKKLRSIDLKAELQASLPDAETQVVDAAVDFVSSGGSQNELTEAVNNLSQIRAAIKAMEKSVAKSKLEPAIAK